MSDQTSHPSAQPPQSDPVAEGSTNQPDGLPQADPQTLQAGDPPVMYPPTPPQPKQPENPDDYFTPDEDQMPSE